MKYPDDLSNWSPNKHISKPKPGGRFAFKPQTTLSSKQQPDFSKLGPSHTHTHTHSKTRLSDSTALRDLGTMVNERAPPKVPLNSINPNGENTSRELSPDDDITALVRGMSSLKGKVRGDMGDPFNPADATNTPTFGHPTKMMSSRKQRADPFIRQKTRPEHHLDSRSSNSNNGARITGPRGPVYQDRRPPPMPMFSSGAPSAPPVASSYAPARHYGEETFYTDPAKASADLKALLEGGMEEGEEEGGEQSQADRPKTSEDPKDAKDGTVDGLKVKLLPHQVEGVEWMRGRELGPVKRGKVPKGGILADDMGLGKTLQTISLILTNQKPAKDAPGWKKHFEKIEKTTLVVAPLALIRQWEHEINDKVEKTHGLKVCVHHGPNRTKRFKELALYDVVITTYQILVSEHGNSSDAENGLKAGCFGLHWWRVVLDEAHTVKNRNAKATKACYALNSEYRWCLSGTPMQNNLDELQSLVKFLRIRPYDDLKEWKEHIDLPLKNGRGHIAIRRLHSLLRCFMKRRTKEILKEAGALNPGGKPSAEGEGSSTGFKVTERKVVTISTALSPAERKFYDRLAARADRSIEQMMQGKVNYANALTLLLRLRQACNHPKLVEGKLEKDKDAMSTDATQKTQDTDIDAMADMFAGMGIVSRDCNICGRGLSHEDNKSGKDICSDCYDDLAYFNNHERPERSERPKKSKKPKDKSRKKDKKKEIVDEKVIDRQIVEVDDEDDNDESPKKTSGRPHHRNTVVDSDDEDAESPKKTARQPRNRNAIVDSDDEEEEAEGSWLVPEDQRGSLHLGEAGGEEDENAEGGGDWIGSDDSEDEESKVEDKSNLSSFIENDESKGDVASDSDDSLASLTDITKRMAAQTLDDGPSHAADTTNAGTDAGTTAADTTAADTTAVSGSSASDSGSGSDSDSDSDESDVSSEEDDSIFYPSRDPNSPQVLASSKIRELIKILQGEVKEHKFIVFSQFTSMLDLVEPFFRKERFRFVRYDGSMKNDQREESLRKLRGDPQTRILLCSLKCGSLGLNLTAATRVVILEPFWNPFVEEQAIDRVHRLTQTVDVIIYKLTVAQTVEERILELQEKKRELAEQAIEGGMRKEALKLGINEIINLFKPGSSENPVVIGADPSAVGNESFNGNERRTAASSQRRPGRPRKEESEVYGRRW